jgi:hypothetical protein
MQGRFRLLTLAMLVALGSGGAGWVRAQQDRDSAGDAASVAPTAKTAALARPAPPADAEAGPPSASSQKPALSEAPPESDATQQPDENEPAASSASAKPAAALPAAPLKRPRYAIAVIQAMDKVTAETIRFEVPVGKPIRYKSLIFIVRACETTAADETISDAAAHVEIDSEPIAQQGAVAALARQVFRGWMFANSPGLNLFQNQAYDAWLIACKTAAPAA